MTLREFAWKILRKWDSIIDVKEQNGKSSEGLRNYFGSIRVFPKAVQLRVFIYVCARACASIYIFIYEGFLKNQISCMYGIYSALVHTRRLIFILAFSYIYVYIYSTRAVERVVFFFIFIFIFFPFQNI